MSKITIFILVINALAFFAFWFDKQAALGAKWRVPEKSLLLISLLGGSIGAVAASRIFRHKTRKQPFKSLLYFVILLQIIGLAIYANNS